MSKEFEQLEVWQLAMDLAADTRAATKYPTLRDDPDLRNQMRRAAVSIPSNIAEGYERPTARDTLKFLGIAKGSAGELRTQLLLAQRGRDMDGVVAGLLVERCKSLSRMIGGYMRSIRVRCGDA